MSKYPREEIDPEAIQEFLELKGAVELLIVLGESDLRHDELESEVPVSGSTFHIRREQASDLGLITRESRKVDDGFKDVYTLTAAGKAIARQARQEGLVKLFWRLQEIREQYDELLEGIPEWVTESESEFMKRVQGIQIHEEDEAPPDADFFR